MSGMLISIAKLRVIKNNCLNYKWQLAVKQLYKAGLELVPPAVMLYWPLKSRVSDINGALRYNLFHLASNYALSHRKSVVVYTVHSEPVGWQN